jgi:hypothetical protein
MLNDSITATTFGERLYSKPRQNPNYGLSEHQRIPRIFDEPTTSKNLLIEAV